MDRKAQQEDVQARSGSTKNGEAHIDKKADGQERSGDLNSNEEDICTGINHCVDGLRIEDGAGWKEFEASSECDEAKLVGPGNKKEHRAKG